MHLLVIIKFTHIKLVLLPVKMNDEKIVAFHRVCLDQENVNCKNIQVCYSTSKSVMLICTLIVYAN